MTPGSAQHWGCAAIVKAVFVNEHGDPPFLLHFYHLLNLFQGCAKYHRKSMASSISRESP